MNELIINRDDLSQLPCEANKPPIDRELLTEWKRIIPQKAFGVLDLIFGRPSFRKIFFNGLLDHHATGITVDQVVATALLESPSANSYSQVYASVSSPSDFGDPTEVLIRNQFQPEFLTEIVKKLATFTEMISSTSMPDLIKRVYLEKIESIKQLIQLRDALGTPEFTAQQQTDEQWEKFFDIEATTKSKQATLPHELLAQQILESNQNIEVYSKVKKVLEIVWKLNEREKREIGFDEIADNDTNLTATQGMSLFSILLKRAGLNWIITSYSGSSITIKAQAKQILFPESRQMSADEVAFIPAHEFVHIISGANGQTQPCSAIESGIEGYVETQEGIAAVAEMIVGQPYGHKRQILFAARYFAVAQAVKVKYDEDTGKHTAMYSMQDIFNQLIEYGISEKDANETVWRIFRGTSLTRKVVELDTVDNEGNKIKIAETYIKDYAYFSGLMKIYDYLIQQAPLSTEDRSKARIKHAKDFHPTVLAHIGRRTRAVMMGGAEKIDREGYFTLIANGRKTLIKLLNTLLVGKLTLEIMTDPDNEWQQFLNTEGLIDYQSIFAATE